MQHRIQGLLVAAAIMFGGMGITSEASANFRIRLDNYANGGTISWAPTANTISVCAFFNGSPNFCTPVGSRTLNSISGQHDFNYVGPETYNHVVGIRVSINGNDAFWLDQIELFSSSGSFIWAGGIDNAVGFCFSTDPTDGDAVSCYPDAAATSHSFSPKFSGQL